MNERGFKLLSAKVDKSQGGDETTSNTVEARVIKVPKDLKKLSISKEGEIFTESGLIGQISVVEFKDPQCSSQTRKCHLRQQSSSKHL